MNPYWGKNFWEFFAVLCQRIGGLITGKLEPVSDEIQLFVLIVLSIASSVVGTFLVLKRMTMLANSLSHTILLGIVIAYLIVRPFSGAQGLDLTVLLIAALITGLLTTVLTQFLASTMRLQEDASIGLVFTTLFALGIVLVTVYTRNTHVGVEAIMGNIDALHFDDLKFISIVGLVDVAVIGLLFKEFKLVTFDSGLASSQGISPSFFNYLLMVLTAALSIAAFRVVGVLLFLAFLVGPVLAARLLTHHLKNLILIAVGLGSFASICAVALARHCLSVYGAALSTSGLVVTLIGVVFVVVAIFILSFKPSEAKLTD